MKEKDICKIFYRLASELNYYNQFPHKYIILHIANERTDKSYYIRNLLQMGMRKGAPDYLILWDGGWAAIEFKRNKSLKQTPSQIEFEKECKLLNSKYLLAYDIDEAIHFLKNI